jgi:hypothetical protein
MTHMPLLSAILCRNYKRSEAVLRATDIIGGLLLVA